MPQNSLHLTHSPLAFLDLFRSQAFLCTAVIVFLNLLCLLIRQNYAGQAGFVCDTNRDAVVAGFLHSVAVNHITEHSDCFVHRCSGETAVCGIGEAVTKVLCKTVGGKHALIGFLELSSNTRLGSVRLVRNTDNVATVREQSSLLAELLNRGNVNAATGTVSQGLCHIGTGFDTAHIVLMQELLCRSKQLCRLCIQILTVNDNDNRRIVEGVRVTQCNHTGQK